MESLHRFIGVEHELDELNLALKYAVQARHAPVVGALHVTCSDEAEHECLESFQRHFVDDLLPELKTWTKAPFRTSNLGGRYEWGAIPIAEQHYASPESAAAFKVLTIKINAHVSVETTPKGVIFGRLRRYHAESLACGALHTLLDGGHAPYLDELRETFHFEGTDRLATLLDAERVEPGFRSLFAAIVSARLQARNAILDIQAHAPTTPTIYLVLPCVTFNRPGRDGELLCGIYTADLRTAGGPVEYRGLGDDPAAYTVKRTRGRIQVEDDGVRAARPARDHRQVVLQTWKRRQPPPAPPDERVRKALDHVEKKRHHDHAYGKVLLATLLAGLAEVAPIPAAIALFAQGAAGIYHAHRAHKLARDLAGNEDAKKILADIHTRIDGLPPEQTRRLVEVLAAEYRK